MQQLDKDLTTDRFVAQLISEIPDSIEYIKRNYDIDDMLDKKIDFDQLKQVVIKAYRREQASNNEH